MACSSHLALSTLDVVLHNLLEAQKKIKQLKDELLLEDGELHPALDGCRTRLRKRERVESSCEELSGEGESSDGDFYILLWYEFHGSYFFFWVVILPTRLRPVRDRPLQPVLDRLIRTHGLFFFFFVDYV